MFFDECKCLTIIDNFSGSTLSTESILSVSRRFANSLSSALVGSSFSSSSSQCFKYSSKNCDVLISVTFQAALGKAPIEFAQPVVAIQDIIGVAGGPGDRWLGYRKMAGREESPDTVLRHADHFAGVILGECEVVGGTLDRATRL